MSWPVASRRRLLGGLAAGSLLGSTALGSSAHAQAARGRSRTKPPDRRCIIDAGWALLHSDAGLGLQRDVSIVVTDDRIEDVKHRPFRSSLPRVDARDQLVLPGFISGHTHVAGGTVTRGIFEGRRSYARALEIAETLDDSALDALTALNLAELLRSGCTTQLDMALSLRQMKSYVRVAQRWGVRAYPSAMIPGIERLFAIWQRKDDEVLRASVPQTLDEIAAALDYARSINGAGDGRILPQMAMHASDTHTPETVRAMLAAARELGNGLHLHLCQSAKEVETVERLWQKRPVQWLESLGVFSQRVFGAHMSGSDPLLDAPILKSASFTYCTCPSAGGASGFTQPWPEMLAAGVNTNIGIDTHSNDYVENLKLAVLKGEARWSLIRKTSAAPMRRPTIQDALEAATLGAARGLGRDDIGRIAVGAKADLISIDVSGLLAGAGALPPEPQYHLLYANGLMVRHVMIDGVFKVFDGTLRVGDEVELLEEGGAVVRKLWSQLASEGYFK